MYLELRDSRLRFVVSRMLDDCLLLFLPDTRVALLLLPGKGVAFLLPLLGPADNNKLSLNQYLLDLKLVESEVRTLVL